MGNITWTKSWSAADNGTVLGGADIQNIQGDITTVVNGGITNANVNGSAAIVESKLAFNTTTGHSHNGTDSRLITTFRHSIYGCEVVYNAAGTFDVADGQLDVGGTLVTLEGTSGLTNIDLAVGGNWISGDSEGASAWMYVYIDADGAIKISNDAPDIDWIDDGTDDQVLRYYDDSASAGDYYRCIGAVRNDASSNILKWYRHGDWIAYDDIEGVADLLVEDDGTDNAFGDGNLDCSKAVPAFSKRCVIQALQSGGGGCLFEIRDTSSSATNGHSFYLVDGGRVTGQIHLDSTQKADYMVSRDTVDIWVTGYYMGVLR